MDTDQGDDGPLLELFRIGPNSVAGRALALRVIFCKKLRRLLVLLRGIVSAKLAALERWGFYGLRKLMQLLDPRSPHFILAAVLCAALLLRRQRLKSGKEVAAYQCKFWKNLMRTALTYDEWAYAASMVEKQQLGHRRKDDELYDEDLIRSKLEDLKKRRMQGDMEEIVFALRTDLLRNLGNMCNPELHKGRFQTPMLIQEYITEVRYHLRAVCNADSLEFPLDEKLAFIHETRHAFGRTALMLSGGAALGAFHLGVVRTLIEHRLLPRVMSGASVGSVICSFAATRTWTELQAFFYGPLPPMAFFESMGSIFATAHRLLTKGALAEIGQLQRKMRLLIGDLTFQEAYDLSGRVLGIPVCSVRPNEPHRLLNYLTSPHVVIWSAVTASCAFPGLFEAQELMAKDRRGRLVPYHMPTEGLPEEQSAAQKRRWRDGSLENDLPMKELKELFNVNHFIVSQANPHIAPLLRVKEVCRSFGGHFAGKLASLVEMEAKHRCQQALALGWRWGGLAKLFAQEWEGDITIVMPATLAQFAKIIQNPTPSELRKAVIQGRRCTWERLSAIQATCGIENMLDECVSDLNQRRKQHALAAKATAGAGRASTCTGNHAGGSSDTSPCRDLSCATKGGKQGPLLSLQQQHHQQVLASASWRRIPSWNRFARERSWGSLDDEAGAAAGLATAAPGSRGGSTGTLDGQVQVGAAPGAALDGSGERSTHSSNQTRWLLGAGIQGTYLHHSVTADSDSDSGTEGPFYHNGPQEGSSRGALMRSWTRAGGPLMASPSCSHMLQLHDNAAAGTIPKGSAGRGGESTALSEGGEGDPSQSHDPSHTRQGGEPLPQDVGPSAARPSSGVPGPIALGVPQEGHGIPAGPSPEWPVPQLKGEAFHMQHDAIAHLPLTSEAHPLHASPSFSLWGASAQFLRPFLGQLVPGAAPQPYVAPSPTGDVQSDTVRALQDVGEKAAAAGAAAAEQLRAIRSTDNAEALARGGGGSAGALVERGSSICDGDEEGMLFGLAIESSMHGGNRSVSLDTDLFHPGMGSSPLCAAGFSHEWESGGMASPRASFSMNCFHSHPLQVGLPEPQERERHPASLPPRISEGAEESNAVFQGPQASPGPGHTPVLPGAANAVIEAGTTGVGLDCHSETQHKGSTTEPARATAGAQITTPHLASKGAEDSTLPGATGIQKDLGSVAFTPSAQSLPSEKVKADADSRSSGGETEVVPTGSLPDVAGPLLAKVKATRSTASSASTGSPKMSLQGNQSSPSSKAQKSSALATGFGSLRHDIRKKPWMMS